MKVSCKKQMSIDDYILVNMTKIVCGLCLRLSVALSLYRSCIIWTCDDIKIYNSDNNFVELNCF